MSELEQRKQSQKSQMELNYQTFGFKQAGSGGPLNLRRNVDNHHREHQSLAL